MWYVALRYHGARKLQRQRKDESGHCSAHGRPFCWASRRTDGEKLLALETPLGLKATSATHPGAVHTVNGDTLGIREPLSALERVEQGWIWVIADGVGQEEAGLRASRLAAQTVVDTYWPSAIPNTSTRLRNAVERANSVLHDENRANGIGQVGATILAATVVDGRLCLAHVGRSRAYVFSDGILSQLTQDHSWVARQVRLGRLTPEEAIDHPRQNFITRCLGIKETVQIDMIERELFAGDVLLLCSDGLYRHFDDKLLAGMLTEHGSEAAPILIDEATRSGAADNVTAVTVAGITAPIRDVEPVDRAVLIGRLGRELSSSLDLDETLRSVLEQLLRLSGGERAAILLRDHSGKLVARVVRNMDPLSQLFSHTVAEEAIQQRRAVLVRNALDDPRFSRVESIVDQGIRSILCVPMIVTEDAIGVLYVDSSTGSVAFEQSDLDVLASFASHAATAIQNARLHDELLKRSREIELGQLRQNAIIRSLSSALISIDERGVVTDWNPKAAEILGRSADEAVGVPLQKAVPIEIARWLTDLTRQVEVSSQTVLTSHEWEGQLGGRPRVVLAGRVARIRASGEKIGGVVFVVNDRTDVVILEEARRTEAAEKERLHQLFNRYVAPSIAERLLRDPDAMQLGGARKEVTILFADVRGFTGISEERQPEDVVRILNHYLTLATSEIFGQLGTLDKFLGDGVMAIFGAPLSLPNHALAALRAAVSMRSRIDDLRRETGVRVGFGIGLNSGSAIVGNIGSPEFMNYTAIGDVVNVSARLQAEARSGEILITDTTLKLVTGNVLVEELGSIYVKGRSTPVTTYKVLSVNN